MRALRLFVLLTLACGGDPPTRRDDGGPESGSEEAGARDAQPDVPADVPAPLPCDDGFIVDDDAREGLPFVVRFTHPSAGLTNIRLLVSGDGAPDARFEALERDEAPFRWRFAIEGHDAGRLDLELVADPAGQVYGTCSVRVLAGTDAGIVDAALPGNDGCVPDCSDAACGGDDGCGTPCAGGHRRDHGGVSDCRLPGNCGCGIEPNDNMECTGEGMCRIRCSCDCLPPQIRSAEEVAGLDHGASCTLVFRESGDATVWDAVNERALCPIDYDPAGDAHCTECPPCHRNRDPCGLARWCECIDPAYRQRDPQYDAMCGG